MSGRQGQFPVPSATADATPAAWRAPDPFEPADPRLGMSLRLPVFVATTSLLGVLAHVLAAGMLPSGRALAVGSAAVAAVGALHRGREARFESLTALLLAGQAVLHTVLCLDGGTTAATLLAGHRGTSVLAGLYPGHTMLLAHLLAAGVTGWWLGHGEAAVWAAARRVWRVARLLPPAPAVVLERPRPIVVTPSPVLLDQVRGLSTCPRRGPPALVAAG